MAAAQEKRDKNRIEDGPYYYRAERRISLRMGAFRNLFWLHEDGDGYAVYSLHQRMYGIFVEMVHHRFRLIWWTVWWLGNGSALQLPHLAGASQISTAQSWSGWDRQSQKKKPTALLAEFLWCPRLPFSTSPERKNKS